MSGHRSSRSGFRGGVEMIRAPLRIMISDLVHGRLPPGVQFINLPDGLVMFNVWGCIAEARTTTTWRRIRTKYHWFVCPYCGRRCRGLFFYFKRIACRQCHGLAYPRKPLEPWW